MLRATNCTVKRHLCSARAGILAGCLVMLMLVALRPGWAAVPAAVGSIPDQSVAPGQVVAVDLRDFFSLPGVEGDLVRVFTTSGNFDIELLADAAPATVQNFLDYVNAGAYTNVLIHRSVPGFVIQTGGFTAGLPPENVPQNPPVINEFNISNTRGTIAMAKLGGDPNSATNQWFVNLADNSENLDNQNGGFTVFARVIEPGMAVVDAIAQIPVYDAGSPFDSIPLQNMQEDQSEVNIENLVGLFGVLPIDLFPGANQNGSALVFSGESTNPEAISASLNQSLLLLSRPLDSTGATTISVRASDLFGNQAEQQFTVLPSEPFQPVPPQDGQYHGLFGMALATTDPGSAAVDGDAFVAANGMVRITVRANGRCSGFIQFEGRRMSFRGQFDENGVLQLPPLQRRGEPDLLLSLAFADPLRIVGSVSRSGQSLPLVALRSPHSGRADDRHPLAGGRFTMLLPATAAGLGDGFATLSTNNSGMTRITGRLPDGAPFNVAIQAVPAADAKWALPVFAPLYARNAGLLWGEVVLPAGLADDAVGIEGGMAWVRPPVGAQAVSGLDSIQLVGGIYTRPARGVSALTNSVQTEIFTARIVPAAGGAANVEQAGQWPPTNRPLFPQPNAVGLRLTFAPATGMIRGVYLRQHNDRLVRTGFAGVLMSPALELPGRPDLRGGGFVFQNGVAALVEITR